MSEYFIGVTCKEEISEACLTRGFHYALQDDDDLKLLCLHGTEGEVIEGAFGVNHVADGERGDEEKLICPGAKTHVQLQLIQREKLPLRCLPGLCV